MRNPSIAPSARLTIADRRAAGRSAIDLLPHAAGLLDAWVQRARQRRQLEMLDDRLLRDLGLTRDEVHRECAKPFWRP
jgi:uncharacterized protein YjiS (DUF1127 family)